MENFYYKSFHIKISRCKLRSLNEYKSIENKKRKVFYSMTYSNHYPLFAEIDLMENYVNKFIPSRDIDLDIWCVETAH